jgi:hypothetical protein
VAPIPLTPATLGDGDTPADFDHVCLTGDDTDLSHVAGLVSGTREAREFGVGGARRYVSSYSSTKQPKAPNGQACGWAKMLLRANECSFARITKSSHTFQSDLSGTDSWPIGRFPFLSQMGKRWPRPTVRWKSMVNARPSTPLRVFPSQYSHESVGEDIRLTVDAAQDAED